MTQVSETLQKLSGGEGRIARGRGRPLVLRFARTAAAAPRRPKTLRDFCRTGGFVHTSCTTNKKGLKNRPFFIGGEGGIRTNTFKH